MLAGIGANAQIPNGSVAPDFTATDINGNTHTLSEYLAQGKTVIIDISATWCGPCWNYHSSHALADLYESYGPGGSDEVVVLFIEGDPTTSVSSIYGVNVPSDQSSTQGNWTVGSPYPIIDSGAIADLYDINAFPTIFRICPDGIVQRVNHPSASGVTALRNGINGDCGTMTGAQNHARIEAEDVRVCETTGDILTKIKNYGVNTITAATIVLKEDGAVVATQEFGSTLNQYSTNTVTFTGVEFNPGADYEAEISTINGAAPLSAELATKPFTVTAASEAANNLMVRVYTDNYPGEISWRIKDSNGTVVYTGGPYQAGPGAAGAGGPDANTTKTHFLTLPDGIDCYTVQMNDAYGDGWSLGNTPHGLEIFNNLTSVYLIEGGNFGQVKTVNAAFKSTGTLGNETFVTEKFAVYPNPSTGIFNFETHETVSVTVSDITGKTVFTASNIDNGGSIDLSALQTGMYIAKIKGATAERVEKLIVK